MRKTLLILGVGLAGVAVGALGATYVGAQGKITRTEVLRKPASGLAGKEVVLFVADFPPGVAAGRHSHPGDEAGYLLQGAIVIEPDGGGQRIELKPGQTAFTPAKQTHNVRNPSSSEPAKLLNCLVVDKGQPVATDVR